MIKILAINISDRIKGARRVQEIISMHAGMVKTRLGFHELSDEVCSRSGYLFLHLTGDPAESQKLVDELNGVLGIAMKTMDFMAPEQDSTSFAKDDDLMTLGLVVKNREEANAKVQHLLTMYGCNIRTRMGLHEQLNGESVGLILLELHGDIREIQKLEQSLKEIDGVILRKVAF